MDPARERRQLEVLSTEAAYTFEGRIDVEAMLLHVATAMEMRGRRKTTRRVVQPA